MELSLIISILTLVIVVVVAYLVFSNKSKDAATLDPEKFETNTKELMDKIEELKTKFMTDISTAQNNINAVIGNLGSTVGQTKGELQTKNDQILKAQQNLLDALTGSKKTGIAGELLLQNLLDQSGLVKGQQWIQNQNYNKDGSTLHVEFAIVHPSKLVMPVDSHWPKDLYNELNDIRREEQSEDRDKREEKKFKEIVRQFGEKAKEVNQKYLQSALSANFAVVYIPSESLHLEISNHVAETNKELWIGEIQKKYNVAFMSPSTFSAYCSALLLGFNSIAVEEKALNFLRYKDKLVNMVTNLCDLTAKLNNKIQGVLKSSGELDDKSTQLKLEIERVERTLKEIEKKNLN